jgi:hypothetical protein
MLGTLRFAHPTQSTSLGLHLRQFVRFPNFSKPLDPVMISDYTHYVLSHSEGRFANVTNAGQDAMDVEGAETKASEADGEVVWS